MHNGKGKNFDAGQRVLIPPTTLLVGDPWWPEDQRKARMSVKRGLRKKSSGYRYRRLIENTERLISAAWATKRRTIYPRDVLQPRVRVMGKLEVEPFDETDYPP